MSLFRYKNLFVFFQLLSPYHVFIHEIDRHNHSCMHNYLSTCLHAMSFRSSIYHVHIVVPEIAHLKCHLIFNIFFFRLCGVAVNAYLTMLLDTGVLHCEYVSYIFDLFFFLEPK